MTANIWGINIHVDRLIDILVRNKIDIALITETHKVSTATVNTLKANGFDCFVNQPDPTETHVWSGTAIIFKSGLTNFISDNYIVTPGRVQRASLLVSDRTIYIFCSYLPQGYPAMNRRVQILNKMKENIDTLAIPATSFIIGGDFNFIEEEIDTANPDLFRNESDAQMMEILKLKFNIQDSFRINFPHKTVFTRTTHNSGTRLDRIYMSTHITRCENKTDFISIPCSDHKLGQRLILNFKKPMKWGPGKWKLNDSLLTEKNINEYEGLWKCWVMEKIEYDSILDWWEVVKKRTKKFFINKGKQNKKKIVSESKYLMEKLQNIYNQHNLSTEEKKRSAAQITAKLYKMQSERVKGNKIRSKIIQINDEEESGTNFYKLENKYGRSKQITTLQEERKIENSSDVEIINHVGKKDVLEHTHKFYTNLWGKTAEINLDEQKEYLSTISQASQNLYPNFALTEEEIEKSHKKLRDSSPGDDGLTSAFYKKCWHLIKDEYFQVCNNVYMEGKMPASMRRAVVTLIPKEGNLKNLKNWRPVSLLNTDYKILSRVIANRIVDESAKIISNEQKCAIKGRNMQDIHLNLLTILNQCKKKGEPAIVTCYDYRKAFDMVDWNFTFKTLEKLNISQTTIKWIKCLYNEICSCVQINGAVTDLILNKRGIRQGCPLSMILFVIAVEPLTRKIKNNVDITSPYADTPIQQYADDATSITNSISSNRAAHKEMVKFCEVSGLVLNPDKTKIFHINLEDYQILELYLMYQERNFVHEIKVLGIIFGKEDIISAMNWKTKIKNIDKIIKSYWHRDLTLLGKVQIINTMAMPHLNIIARLQRPSKNQIKSLNKIFFNFLWHPLKIEPLARVKLTKNKLNGGIGIPDLSLRIDALYSQRLKFLFGISAEHLVEPWMKDACYQLGTRIRQFNANLYSNLRPNAESPNETYKYILDIYGKTKHTLPNWENASLKSVYSALIEPPNLQLKWTQTMHNDPDIKRFFTNREREMSFRIRHQAYFWGDFNKRHSGNLYSQAALRCNFCWSMDDNVAHLFNECPCIKIIFDATLIVVNDLTNQTLCLSKDLLLEGKLPPNAKSKDWMILKKAINIVKMEVLRYKKALEASKQRIWDVNSFKINVLQLLDEDLSIFIGNMRNLLTIDQLAAFRVQPLE